MNQNENQHIAYRLDQLSDELERRYNNTKVLKHPALVEHNDNQFVKELRELRDLIKQIK